jgi:hypothetical protein
MVELADNPVDDSMASCTIVVAGEMTPTLAFGWWMIVVVT